MKPTTEQAAAVDLFRAGRSLAIEAGAGTGKTSTLVLLGRSTPRFGQYVAFNKAIVEDSRAKLPSTVASSTAHGLAFRAVGRTYAHRLQSGRMPSRELAARLRTPSYDALVAGQLKRLTPAKCAGLVMRALSRFCSTADPEPAEHHFPYVDGIDEFGPDGRPGWANNRELHRLLLPAVRRAWADWQDPRGQLPFKHEAYLKIWELSGPRLDVDYILFDEAQDASPVLVSIVRQQHHAQLVWVGDSQQAIYEFTGAVNALASVPADDRTFLTQSFRFGPAIADVANLVMAKLDAPLRLLGHQAQASRVAPVAHPHAVLTRTNAGAVTRYLRALEDGHRPHLVGGGRDVVQFAQASLDLRERGWTSHPELQCFTSWGAVQDYVVQDPQGGELKLLVTLVDDFGAEEIIGGLQHMTREDQADMVLSTAHKSKGREWPTVQLADDFPSEDSERPLEPADWRLLYVAATRARGVLDITRCRVLADLVDAHPGPEQDGAAPVLTSPLPVAEGALF